MSRQSPPQAPRRPAATDPLDAPPAAPNRRPSDAAEPTLPLAG